MKQKRKQNRKQKRKGRKGRKKRKGRKDRKEGKEENTNETPAGHQKDTSGTPAGHKRDTSGTPAGHQRDTIVATNPVLRILAQEVSRCTVVKKPAARAKSALEVVELSGGAAVGHGIAATPLPGG